MHVSSSSSSSPPWSSSVCTNNDHYDCLVPGPPKNVQAYNTSATSINITWDVVPPREKYEDVIAYEVTMTTTDNSTGKQIEFKLIKATCTNAKNMSWHQTGLNEYTLYKIRVAVVTQKGFGNATREIRVLTDEDGGYINVFNARAHKQTHMPTVEEARELDGTSLGFFVWKYFEKIFTENL